MAIESTAGEFSARTLLTVLSQWPNPNRYLVAFSGGLDSTALLQTMVEIRDQLSAAVLAIHINHGLQGDADDWQAHCQSVCDSLDIRLISEQLTVPVEARKSPEALARDARYQAISQHMENGDLLLTAHHQDDQAETLLLNLLRGAGVHGLAAMRPHQSWRQGHLGRPLLDWPRSALQTYLQSRGARWLEDPSNQDTRYSRNYLRQHVLPEITGRWPAAVQRLTSSAALCAQAAGLLNQLADEDLLACNGNPPDVIELTPFGELSQARQTLLLRRWAQRNQLPLPSQKILQQAALQLTTASSESMTLLEWPGAEIRSAGQLAYIMPTLPELPDEFSSGLQEFNQSEQFRGYGKLILHTGVESVDTSGWRVCARTGGEQLKPAGDRHSRRFKYLCQAAGIPAWLRPYIPLLKRDGELLAIGDLWLADSFSRHLAQQGADWSWAPGVALLQRLRDVIIGHQPAAG